MAFGAFVVSQQLRLSDAKCVAEVACLALVALAALGVAIEGALGTLDLEGRAKRRIVPLSCSERLRVSCIRVLPRAAHAVRASFALTRGCCRAASQTVVTWQTVYALSGGTGSLVGSVLALIAVLRRGGSLCAVTSGWAARPGDLVGWFGSARALNAIKAGVALVVGRIDRCLAHEWTVVARVARQAPSGVVKTLAWIVGASRTRLRLSCAFRAEVADRTGFWYRGAFSGTVSSRWAQSAAVRIHS